MSKSKISIIFVDTQLPENVGLSSRAMFNCGREDMKIVSHNLEWTAENENAVAVDSHSRIESGNGKKDIREAIYEND